MNLASKNNFRFQPSRFLLLIVSGATCAFIAIPASIALALGAAASFIGLSRNHENTQKIAGWLLQSAIVCLGAGIDFPQAMRVGIDGLGITFLSIAGILLLGLLLGRLLKVPRQIAFLVSAGTAICGGSAIAAIAAVLKPKSHETATSLAIVFILNGIALFLFPAIGHWLHLSETVFGWWAALSIHDTSSVVGAGAAYGETALQLATTIKLARALWIVPLALAVSAFVSQRRLASDGQSEGGFRFPWFILAFIGAAAIVWLFPALEPTGKLMAGFGHHALAAALFFIGACINFSALKQVGYRVVILGLTLWIPTASLTLLYSLHYR